MEKFINQSPLFLVIICLIIGFAFLMKGADYFVEGSSSVAKRLKVPSIIIGLTIVAMGTSLPETAVSVTASIANNNALAISNVVGSNIFNMMFVIGVCSILATIGVKRETIIRDIPLSLVCATLLLIFGYLAFGDRSHMILGRFDGIIFLIIFAVYVLMMVFQAMRARNNQGRFSGLQLACGCSARRVTRSSVGSRSASTIPLPAQMASRSGSVPNTNTGE